MAIFTSVALGAGLISLGSGFLATVSAIALNAAVGIGLQLAIASMQKQEKSEPLGVRGKMQAGGDVARSIIFGRRATAGSLAYANTWGSAGKTPNAYFTQVIALADMPVGGLTGMWVNGEPVTVNTADGSLAGERGYPITEYNGYLWVKFYNGTQTVADPFLVSTVSSVSRPYESTRVGRGVAYAIVTARANGELFSGFPSFRFEVQGMPLYDVSKDSTVGGSGSHRWDNPATWGGDGDDFPAVQVYNIMRGITYAGDWVYGLQNTPAARFPVSDWIAQIAKCRLAVDGPDGPEAQYTTGAEISVGTQIKTTVETLLMGCHGRPIEAGGTYKIRIGEPGAPSYTFSDDDILSTDPQSFKPIVGLADSVNGITARYPEPAEAWNTKAAAPLYNPGYEARDGNRRLVSDLDLTTVSRSRQVQQIMQAALKEARRERRHTFALPPAFWTAEPGDICAWTSERNGYVSKYFRIDGVGDRANLDVMVDITEVDPTDYPFDFFTDYRPPVFSTVTPGWPQPQPMFGWTAVKAIIYDASGNARRPSIKVGCAPDQDDVAKVWVQVRLKSSGAIVFDSDATPYAAPYEWILNGNFLPTTVYEVRGKFVPFTRRVTEWSSWIEVTTDNVKLSAGLDFDPYAGTIGLDSLGDDIREYQEWLGSGRREIEERLAEIGLIIADQDLSNAVARKQIREQITATRNGITADYLREVNVLASADQALALDVTQLNSRITSAEGGISGNASALTALQTRVTSTEGDIDAIADLITSLESDVGNVSAAVNVRATAVAGPGGGYSRYAIQVKNSSGDWSSQAGLYLETHPTNPSRILLDAQQLFFGDLSSGAAPINPLAYSGGVWRLAVANIGTVLAGTINFGSGRVVINQNGITVTA